MIEGGAKGLLICGYEAECCLNTKEELCCLAKELSDKEPQLERTQVESLQGDLSIEEDCRAVMKFVDSKWGSVHGLVNAAAIGTRGRNSISLATRIEVMTLLLEFILFFFLLSDLFNFFYCYV